MSELRVCDGCHRHVRVDDARCPFCAASQGASQRAARAMVITAITVAAGLSMQACYGGPPHPEPYPRPQGSSGQSRGALVQAAEDGGAPAP